MAKDPQHPGADHYYIHELEASPNPGKGVAAAEQLPALMPAPGHLEHMPAHIMHRVGRYEDAPRPTAGASPRTSLISPRPSRSTITSCTRPTITNSWRFRQQWRAERRRLSRRRASRAPSSPMFCWRRCPGSIGIVGELYAAMTRFGPWDEILAEPAPNPNLIGLTGAFLYAKTTALAAESRIDDAKTQLTELEKLEAALGPDNGAGVNRLDDVLAVAILSARARIALAEGAENDAIGLLREAVKKEDQLAYDEPADWFFPIRHLLGAVLIKAGRAADAEIVYRDDLSRHPNNGWALFGLTQSLKIQGRSAEASSARQQLDTAWKNADVTLVASAY